MNVIRTTRKYAFVDEVVYPKYSVMEPREFVLSGNREQSVHLYAGLGIPGAILHGTIGTIIDDIKASAETIPEYINFRFNCIFRYVFRSL